MLNDETAEDAAARVLGPQAPQPGARSEA